MNIGLISGRAPPNLIINSETVTVETAYGPIEMEIARCNGHEIYFVARHGPEANIPPHKVNYHGNIQALSDCQIEYLISVGTVGSLNQQMKTGDIVIPHDFIDITKNRNYSFFDKQRVHMDLSNPFCPTLRNLLITQSKKTKSLTIHDKGIYLVTEGPRLETPAEIKMYSSFADIVGMTLVPEVTLTHEKGLCYVSICLVCNMAAGIQKKLPANEITDVYHQKASVITELIKTFITNYKTDDVCCCKADLSKADL
jgi:5'-methylthioadenosine phosphorylase